MPCTLVTAYYDISSKATKETYLDWAKSFMKLEAPVILFTAAEFEEAFREMRGSLPIKIYTIPFSELYMWKTYEAKWRQHHIIDRERSIHAPELYAMWAQKVVFVDMAIEDNPFDTDHFFWCDIGAFREGPPEKTICESFPSSRFLPHDRVAICSLNPLESEDKIECKGIIGDFRFVNRIVGGLWGGGTEGCKKWRKAYETMLQIYFDSGKFAGKDQSVFLSALLADKSIAGVFKAENSTDWFYFQRLHSDIGAMPTIDTSYL